MEKVIEILKQQNYTDEQISAVLAEVTKALYSKLYSEMLLVLTEEDLKSIENTSEKDINDEIRYFYKLRVGKDPDEEAKKFYEDFAKGFIAEYEKTKANN